VTERKEIQGPVTAHVRMTYAMVGVLAVLFGVVGLLTYRSKKSRLQLENLAELLAARERVEQANLELRIRARELEETRRALLNMVEDLERSRKQAEAADQAAGTEVHHPHTRVSDSEIGTDALVEQSVVRGARIGAGALVGPNAFLRPGAVLEAGAKVGSFVEVKNTTIGEGSKVPHLSYIGDATIGRDVNVGAGAITCNFDGRKKHPTFIGDGAFIGSDTMLVAPVTIGSGAVTGAGSAISKDVPDGALGIERAEQRNIDKWAARRRP
jgi:bifunctional N-acetylglucosamine-1-phosphate-uridyltransferase/glucosamine-1-phosphate-acetyltransferase GlmU-like protein